VSKGRFFHKRDFEIKRGLINFDDPIKPDPSLDISAVSDVASYRVSIGISGRASAPIVGITADPPTRPDGQALTEMEIIGLLSRGSLPSTQGGRNSSESAAAAEALNILAGQVEDTVQKIFDLSGQNVIRQVYIDTYAPEGGTPVARFNLPLNITDDFDVILKVDQSTLKVSSEYSLHDSISLTGGIESTNDKTNSAKSTGAPADTGVDLRFKFSFP
jgi:translocation and assembly module TamB